MHSWWIVSKESTCEAKWKGEHTVLPLAVTFKPNNTIPYSSGQCINPREGSRRKMSREGWRKRARASEGKQVCVCMRVSMCMLGGWGCGGWGWGRRKCNWRQETKGLQSSVEVCIGSTGFAAVSPAVLVGLTSSVFAPVVRKVEPPTNKAHWSEIAEYGCVKKCSITCRHCKWSFQQMVSTKQEPLPLLNGCPLVYGDILLCQIHIVKLPLSNTKLEQSLHNKICQLVQQET